MAKDKLQEGARKHLDLVVELTQTQSKKRLSADDFDANIKVILDRYKGEEELRHYYDCRDKK